MRLARRARPPAHPGAGRAGSRGGIPRWRRVRVRSEQLSPSAEQVFQRSRKPRGRPHFPLRNRVVSGPPPAAQVTASRSGRSGKSGGLGRSRQGSGTGLGAPRCTAVSWEGGGGRDSPFWAPGFGNSLAGLPGAEPRRRCFGLPGWGGLGRRPTRLRPTPGRPGLGPCGPPVGRAARTREVAGSAPPLLGFVLGPGR